MTDSFREPQRLNMLTLPIYAAYFPSIHWSCFAIRQLSSSVQWIFLVLFVTGRSQAAGGVLESGQQGSTTVVEWNLEGQRATFFLIRSAAVQCHIRPVDPFSVECDGLYAKAGNILLLHWHPQLKPDWLTGLPLTLLKGCLKNPISSPTSVTRFSVHWPAKCNPTGWK